MTSKASSQPVAATRFRRKPLITALEPRLLLDGAAVATTVDMTTDVAYQEQTEQSAPAPETTTPAAAAPAEPTVPATTPTASDEPVPVDTPEAPTDPVVAEGAEPDAGARETTSGTAQTESIETEAAATSTTPDGESATSDQTDALAGGMAPTTPRRETAFVDTQVQDYQTLVDGLDDTVEVHLIDASSNGLEQIAQVLQGQTGIDAIHIYSHGDVGQVTLGSLTLGVDNLGQYTDLLSQIGQSLSADADLLLYGCYVGANSEGQDFIDGMAQLTGADVAASDDLTGSDRLTGDWDLEAQSGSIEASELAIASFEGVLAAPVISALDASITFLEGSGPITVDSNISIAGGGTYTEGYVRFSIASPTSGDQLTLSSSPTPTANGAISVVGTDVYLGNGTTRDRIGSIDAVENGQNGAALKILFSSPLPNAGFEEGEANWTVVDAEYGDGGDEIEFDGYSIPLANNSDGNSTYSGGTGTVNIQAPDGTGFSGSVVSGLGVNGSKALYLSSTGSIQRGDQDPAGSFKANGYGSIHGPYARSSVISVETGDSISLDFKAVGSGDDYEVFGLLRKVDGGGAFLSNSLVDGNNIVLFAERGADTGGYKTVTKAGLVAGSYRFEFVGGTYDGSGGLVVGSNLYVDNIRLISSKTVDDSVATTIARQVQYQSTATDSPTSRTLTVTAANQNLEIGSSTTTLNITQANNAPSFTGNVTLAAVNEDASPGGSTVSALFTSVFSDPDSAYTPPDSLSGIAVVADASAGSQGTWEYSTDGTNWYGIGTVSTSSALVLSSSTLVRFKPAADWNGSPGSLSVHAVDSTYAGSYTSGAATATFDTTSDGTSSSVSASPVTLSTSVSAVNDAPTLSGMPTDITVTEDVASDVDLSGTTLADIDSAGSNFTVTLAVGVGTLAASSAGGVTVSGSGSSTITLTGTVSSIESYLNTASSVRYTGVTNANGDNATTLTFTANDQNGSGNVSLGTSYIDITAVNDAPTIKGVGSVSVNEDQSLTISGFTIGDVDGDTVRVRIQSNEGSLTLGTSTGTTVHTSGSTLEFSGSVADVGAALNTTRYAPDANFNGTDDLTVEISDDGGATWQFYTVDEQGKFFYPFNGHYYEFVSAPGITWTAAKTAAEARTLYGLNGYLVTVTSAEEQAFIAPKLGGEGWMGASDSATEGTWIWAVGPEAGTQFWQDESLELGTTENFPGSTVDGRYQNWASSEPNNYNGNEDYAHFLRDGYWNDYDLATFVSGYVVEYGGTGFGTLTAAPLRVTVSSVNDAAVFTSSAVSVSLTDTAATDTFPTSSGTLTASDDHNGAPTEDGTLTYGITGGTDGGTAVSMTGTYGTLTVTKTGGAYSYVPDANVINQLPEGTALTETFSVTVSDGQGGLTTQSFTINVTPANDRPVGVADVASVIESGGVSNASSGSNASGNLLTNDTDIDSTDTPSVNGAVVQVRETTAGTNASVAAGTTSSTGLSISGLYGTLKVGADGSYQYDIDELNASVQALRVTGQTLTERFTYTLSDTGGLTDEATLTITIDGRNDNPVGVDDAATAVERGGVSNGTLGANATGNVLSNDTDADSVANGETKTVTTVRTGAEAGSGTSGTVGTSLTGTYGSLTLNSDGSFTYVIDESNVAVQALRVTGQTLSESFAYTVTDTGGLTDVATLTITIDGRNDNPVGVDDAATALEASNRFNGTAGADATGNVLSNDTDVDSVANGETKTVSAVRTGGESGSGSSGTVGQALVGTYGSLTLNADGSYAYVIDDSNAAVQALRVSGQTLVESFTYTVQDTGGLTDQATLTITIDGRNDNPVANDDVGTAIEAGGVFNGTAGANATGNVLANDTDVDSVAGGETKTVTALRTGAEGGGGRDGVVGQALAGTYGRITINADGSYTYVVDDNNPTVQALRVAGQTLTESFTYTVTDAGGLTDIATLTITIEGRNDAPVAESFNVPDQIWPFGKAYRLDISAPFSDVDSAANGEAFNFSISGLPSGLSYDPNTGVISGSPSGIGTFTVVITASDREGASISRQFVLEILPPAQQDSPQAPLPPVAPAPTDGGTSGLGTPTDNTFVNGDNNPFPTGTITTDFGGNLGNETGYLSGESAFTDPGALPPANQNASGDGAQGAAGPAPEQPSGSDTNASERLVLAEGETRVTEYVNPEGKVTSVRATVQVDVGANGQVVFSDAQKQAFDIVGLSISSIVGEQGAVSVKIADQARGTDTQFYAGELGNGESLPSWIRVNQNTGEITISNPPPELTEVTVRVKAIGSDGKVRILEVELELDKLLKRVSMEDSEPTVRDTVKRVAFVPLSEQVTAQLADHDQYGDRLMAMLELV